MERFARLSVVMVGCWALSAAPAAIADVVRLRDGTAVEGDIQRTEDGWVVVADDGRRRLVPFAAVASIEARPKTGGDAAAQRLVSLRRALDNVSDPRAAIDRYRVFIAQFDGNPAAEQARTDLQVWQDRADKKLVKLGDRWLAADERADLDAKSADAARAAIDLFRQSRLREAAPLLDKGVADNPRAAALWYLKGVMHFRQDQIAAARKAFETVLTILPDHAPSLNNLGVILWRQNAQTGALNRYDQALRAAPASRPVLDNLAEALNALPDEQRNGSALKTVVRHFTEQDLALQDAMRRQGMFRWGSTWVAKADLEKLKAADKDIQDKLDDLSREYDTAAARIGRIDADIDYNERIARRMEASSYGVDAATGRVVRYPLPASYGDLLRDNAALKGERDQRVIQQDQLRRKAQRLRLDIPTPRFTGVQRLIDVEGMPVPAPAALPGTGVGAAPPPAANPVAPPGPETKPATAPPEKPSILDRRLADPDPRDRPPTPRDGGR